MSDVPYKFYSRQEVADYFKVTRMTIYRWEKIVPLHGYGHQHLKSIYRSDIDQWYIDVHRSPRYRRAHQKRKVDVTSHRRDATSSRYGPYGP